MSAGGAWLRRHLVAGLLLVAALVAGLILRHDLVAWFTGTPMGPGAVSKPVRAQAGAYVVDATVRPDPPREQGNTLLVTVRDRKDLPVEAATLTVTHSMPAMGSMPEMRGTATIVAQGQGRYQARFDLPMGGSWTLEVAVAGAAGLGSARFQLTVGTPGLTVNGATAGPTRPAELEEPALAPTALAGPALEALRRGFDATERVRVELAFDRLDGVPAPARDAAQAVHATIAAAGATGALVGPLNDAAAAAARLASATDLAGARAAYGELNRFLIAVAAADPRLQAGWHVFKCPMAQGFKKWFQRSPDLENPYMGRSMPTCGGSSTWGAAPRPDAGGSHEGHGHAGDDVSFYTCSMHPAVRKEDPGTCPICSMDLTPVNYDEEESGVIFVDEARRAQVGIRTSQVVRAPMVRAIRAVGRITYDESRLEDVTLKLSGFIAKLHVTSTGQPVKRGQILFTLYSPELYAAQQEYLLASRRHGAAGGADPGGADYLARASEKKLRLWGLTSGQLAAIAKRGEPLEEVPFYAPAAGFVIEKNVVEGAAVMAGDRLFRIAALDRVWVEASVYEADLASIRAGQPASIALSYLAGRAFEGKVAYVYPYLDPATRTGRVRIELPNTGLELKPDMYATVTFHLDLGPRLQAPIAAVVYTGPRRLVFVDLGEGRLRPQEVTLGARADDLVEVVSGLQEGQRVVTSGNFLVAAESRIRSSAKFWQEERAGGATPADGGVP